MEYIEHLSSWIYFSIAVIFIIIDIFVISTEVLILVAGSFFVLGFLRIFDTNGMVMLMSFPTSLFILTLGYRKLIKHSRESNQRSGIVGSINGMEAEVISVEGNGGFIKILGGGEWKFTSEGFHPKLGDQVIVRKTEGLIAFIEKKGE